MMEPENNPDKPPPSSVITNAATTPRTTEFVFNPRYLMTPTGILRIIELVFGLICWALVAEISPYSAPHQYVMFATVTPWILTLALFFIYLFSLNSTALAQWPWSLIEFIFNGFWGLLYFIAACVAAAYTNIYLYSGGFTFIFSSSQLIAAAVFAFFTTTAYVLHGALEFMEWRGTPIGNPLSGGIQVNA